jgi:hypothetical protein
LSKRLILTPDYTKVFFCAIRNVYIKLFEILKLLPLCRTYVLEG